jgi:hypothetical protein
VVLVASSGKHRTEIDDGLAFVVENERAAEPATPIQRLRHRLPKIMLESADDICHVVAIPACLSIKNTGFAPTHRGRENGGHAAAA